jgi:hypothetical protein
MARVSQRKPEQHDFKSEHYDFKDSMKEGGVKTVCKNSIKGGSSSTPKPTETIGIMGRGRPGLADEPLHPLQDPYNEDNKHTACDIQCPHKGLHKRPDPEVAQRADSMRALIRQYTHTAGPSAGNFMTEPQSKSAQYTHKNHPPSTR